MQLPLRPAWLCCSSHARARSQRTDPSGATVPALTGQGSAPLLPPPAAKPEVPGIPAQLRTPTAPFAGRTLGRGCLETPAQLKLAGQQRGRGCISFTTCKIPPAARVTILRTARDYSSLEPAVAQAGQSSPMLQESNHKQFREFLFSASTQLQAECK